MAGDAGDSGDDDGGLGLSQQSLTSWDVTGVWKQQPEKTSRTETEAARTRNPNPSFDPLCSISPNYGSFSLDRGGWFLTLKLLIVSNVLILVCMLFGYACRIIS